MATEHVTTRTFASTLPAAQELGWRHAMRFTGINDELYPWLRMTAPAGASALDPRTEPLRPLMVAVVGLLFRHRHRRLARRYCAVV